MLPDGKRLGSEFLEESLSMIGKQLGHSQVQTTARYAHLADNPIKLSVERVSGTLANALGALPTGKL